MERHGFRALVVVLVAGLCGMAQEVRGMLDGILARANQGEPVGAARNN